MTPGARIAAAIEVLDGVIAGANAEQVLTRWSRSNRFAGSKDRAAIRDHVFDALRRWNSCATVGGGEAGRARMIGLMAMAGADLSTLFSGEGYAPAPLTPQEQAALNPDNQPDPALDIPDWIRSDMAATLGADFPAIAASLQNRAPVFARINTKKSSQDVVIKSLNDDQIEARPHALSPTALELTKNARRVGQSSAYGEGWIELQDAASQAVVDSIFPLKSGARVLDYCAGGGGKALAIAAGSDAEVFAHDANPQRMRDLPARAARAGTPITRLTGAELAQQAPFDLVVTDVPCSGSGAWRRQPQAKLTLSRADLTSLCGVQAEILDAASAHVVEGGRLIYMTCSLLACENHDQIAAFLGRNPAWQCTFSRQFTPLDGGDGFFVAHLIGK